MSAYSKMILRISLVVCVALSALLSGGVVVANAKTPRATKLQNFCNQMAKVAESGKQLAEHPTIRQLDKTFSALRHAAKLAPTSQVKDAIFAAELDYEQMWAQDVAAMTGYHSNADAAGSAALANRKLKKDLRKVRVYVSHKC